MKHIATPMSLPQGCVDQRPGEARETDLRLPAVRRRQGPCMIYLNRQARLKDGQRRPAGNHVVELCGNEAARIEAQRGGQSNRTARSRTVLGFMIPPAKLERLLFALVDTSEARDTFRTFLKLITR